MEDSVLVEALNEFARNLCIQQIDLSPEAAQVLRDNLWDLYDESPLEKGA